MYKDNWKNDIILIDKYDIIIKIWKYLQSISKEDLLSLPDMKYGDSVDDHKYLCDEERWLIGFCINRGSANPKKTAKKFNSWNKNKVDIANNLYKIKHWDIRHGDYNEFEDVNKLEATWFIDPPYQYQGKYYKYNDIDYDSLATWCKERKGQIIVCENNNADWLNFKPLIEMQGQLHRSTEAIWYKE